MKLAALLLFVTLAATAQTPQAVGPVTDADKIADALKAGPAFITKDATILDWPATKGGEYRVLRKGTSEWTCLPAFPGYSHDEPGALMSRSCSGSNKAWPAKSLISTGSGLPICTSVPGSPTSQVTLTRRKEKISTSVRTS
jgi:hypothetical protein